MKKWGYKNSLIELILLLGFIFLIYFCRHILYFFFSQHTKDAHIGVQHPARAYSILFICLEILAPAEM